MRWILASIFVIALAAVGWAVIDRLASADDAPAARGGQRAAPPVALAPVMRGPIEWIRTYSGTLEARAQFVISPKVAGRVEKLSVDLGDAVRRGQVVAKLDDAEFAQALEQAKADAAVAEAHVTEATHALAIAERALKRVTALSERGIASESQLDTAKAERLAQSAALQVAKAQAQRAKASLSSARIRLGYTQVTANWADSDETRIVAERFVDAGETVSANTPLITLVDLSPIVGVLHVTDKDYGRLSLNQPITLTTDAYPDRVFNGRVQRIAPVFDEDSRQARVELAVPNEDLALKPGMFIRARVMLDRAEDAVIVPVEALVTRDERTGVFVLNPDGATVSWRPVETGIRQDGRVQVLGAALTGRVVTLGQQLIDDGSRVTLPRDQSSPAPASSAADDAEAAR